MGKKKQPSYRFIVSEKTKDTQGRSLEIIGKYNPIVNPKVLDIDKERVLYWISVGAQPSNTVNNILIKEGIITGKKMKSVTITTKRAKKIAEKKA